MKKSSKNKQESKKTTPLKVKTKRKPNWKVVILSIVALICLVLTYYNWLFIIPVAVIIWINQKELMKESKK